MLNNSVKKWMVIALIIAAVVVIGAYAFAVTQGYSFASAPLTQMLEDPILTGKCVASGTCLVGS